MRLETDIHEYQWRAIDHIIAHKGAGVILDMGLGKTVITLTAIDWLMNKDLSVDRVLVIAPKRVAEDTWTAEAAEWEHLKHLRVSVVLGDAKKRRKALAENADIYVINRENTKWIVDEYEEFPFDCVVIDELSSFKNHTSQRFKALRKVRPQLKRVIGLTGTPSPNGLIDLWAQVFLLDMGQRLGQNITKYRNTYFVPGRTNGQIVFDYRLRKGAANIIQKLISDICISMAAKDYLQMPKRNDIVRAVTLSDTVIRGYKRFEKEQIMNVDEESISAVNAAALTGKLMQYSNGAIYDEDRGVHLLHDEKVEVLDEIIEASQGEPVLVFYNYQHDKDRLLSHYPDAVVLDDAETKKRWNDKEINIMLAHPASCAYGLNLQHGGNIIVWFGLTWSLELYEQANARLYRQGQSKPVMIYHLICKDTIDEDVMIALSKKESGQEALKAAIKYRKQQYNQMTVK